MTTSTTTPRRTPSQPGENTVPTSTCPHHADTLVLVALVRDEDLGLSAHEPRLVVADALDVARGAAVAAHGLLCLVCGDLALPQQGRAA